MAHLDFIFKSNPIVLAHKAQTNGLTQGRMHAFLKPNTKKEKEESQKRKERKEIENEREREKHVN